MLIMVSLQYLSTVVNKVNSAFFTHKIIFTCRKCWFLFYWANLFENIECTFHHSCQSLGKFPPIVLKWRESQKRFSFSFDQVKNHFAPQKLYFAISFGRLFLEELGRYLKIFRKKYSFLKYLKVFRKWILCRARRQILWVLGIGLIKNIPDRPFWKIAKSAISLHPTFHRVITSTGAKPCCLL